MAYGLTPSSNVSPDLCHHMISLGHNGFMMAYWTDASTDASPGLDDKTRYELYYVK